MQINKLFSSFIAFSTARLEQAKENISSFFSRISSSAQRAFQNMASSFNCCCPRRNNDLAGRTTFHVLPRSLPNSSILPHNSAPAIPPVLARTPDRAPSPTPPAVETPEAPTALPEEGVRAEDQAVLDETLPQIENQGRGTSQEQEAPGEVETAVQIEEAPVSENSGSTASSPTSTDSFRLRIPVRTEGSTAEESSQPSSVLSVLTTEETAPVSHDLESEPSDEEPAPPQPFELSDEPEVLPQEPEESGEGSNSSPSDSNERQESEYQLNTLEELPFLDGIPTPLTRPTSPTDFQLKVPQRAATADETAPSDEASTQENTPKTATPPEADHENAFQSDDSTHTPESDSSSTLAGHLFDTPPEQETLPSEHIPDLADFEGENGSDVDLNTEEARSFNSFLNGSEPGSLNVSSISQRGVSLNQPSEIPSVSFNGTVYTSKFALKEALNLPEETFDRLYFALIQGFQDKANEYLQTTTTKTRALLTDGVFTVTYENGKNYLKIERSFYPTTPNELGGSLESSQMSPHHRRDAGLASLNSSYSAGDEGSSISDPWVTVSNELPTDSPPLTGTYYLPIDSSLDPILAFDATNWKSTKFSSTYAQFSKSLELNKLDSAFFTYLQTLGGADTPQFSALDHSFSKVLKLFNRNRLAIEAPNASYETHLQNWSEFVAALEVACQNALESESESFEDHQKAFLDAFVPTLYNNPQLEFFKSIYPSLLARVGVEPDAGLLPSLRALDKVQDTELGISFIDKTRQGTGSAMGIFNPLKQWGRLPFLIKEFFIAGKKVFAYSFSTPTIQGNALFDDTKISPIFQYWTLRFAEDHLYGNLQPRFIKASYRSTFGIDVEAYRARQIEKYKGIKVISLPNDGAIYEQSGEHAGINNATTFKNNLVDAFTKIDPNEDLSRQMKAEKDSAICKFPLEWLENGYKEEVRDIAEMIHSTLFDGAEELDRHQRQNFVEVMEGFLFYYGLLELEPNSFNLSCKDAIDRAGKNLAVLSLIDLILEDKENHPQEIIDIIVRLNAATFLSKGQSIITDHHRRERLVGAWEALGFDAEQPKVKNASKIEKLRRNSTFIKIQNRAKVN